MFSSKARTKLLQLCKDDHLRKDAIMRIMGRMGLSFPAMVEKWGIVFELYFRESLKKPSLLESDGFLKVTDNGISITETGRLFLRNSAMCFDRYLHASVYERSFFKKTVLSER